MHDYYYFCAKMRTNLTIVPSLGEKCFIGLRTRKKDSNIMLDRRRDTRRRELNMIIIYTLSAQAQYNIDRQNKEHKIKFSQSNFSGESSQQNSS